MQISLVLSNTVSFFQTNVLNRLTDQNKKIIAVASLAIGILTICLTGIYCRCRFMAKKTNSEEGKSIPIPTPDGPQSKQDGIEKQQKTSTHPALGTLKGPDPVRKETPDPKVASGNDRAGNDKESQSGPKQADLKAPAKAPKDDKETKNPTVKNTDGTEKSQAPKDNIERGVIKVSNGVNETGDFLNGKLHGKGMRVYPQGAVADGIFVNGELNGQGCMIYLNDVIAVGNFKEGQLNGQGTITYPLALKTYDKPLKGFEETYREVEFHMSGNLQDSNERKAKEEGEFVKGGLVAGTIRARTGHVLEGNFKNDMLDGQGTLTLTGTLGFQKGIFKDGVLIKGVHHNAFGTTKSEGTFKDGLLQGQGKRTRDGVVEEGTFEMDQLIEGTAIHKDYLCTIDKAVSNKPFLVEGIKVYHYSDSEKAKSSAIKEERGTFLGITLHNGTRSYLNGDKEEGQFKKGFLSEGTYVDPDGTKTGKFKEDSTDLINGKCTHNDGIIDEGAFQDGALHGKGKRTYPDGMLEEGNFDDGELEGAGKITFSDKRIAEGKFHNGVFNNGTITHPNGMKEEGEFENDVLHGAGKRAFNDDWVEEGIFDYGKIKKE